MSNGFVTQSIAPSHMSCTMTLLFILSSVAELYEYAMLPEHMSSPDPTVGENSITETGALCISSGSKTGRVPKQKRIVVDDITRDVSKPELSRHYQSESLLNRLFPTSTPISLNHYQ